MKIGLTFNYSNCDSHTLGTYNYDYYDAEGNVYVNDYTITSTGELIDNSKSILFIALLIFFSALFLLSFYFLITLRETYQTVLFLSISYLFLILIVYLLEQITLAFSSLVMFSGIMSTLLISLIIGLFPLVLGEGTYLIYKNFSNKREKELKEMGYSDDEVRRYK